MRGGCEAVFDVEHELEANYHEDTSKKKHETARNHQ